MKKAIKIILNSGEHQSKAGTVFENLISTILSSHQYKITKNVHITGLEIDLFAEHKIKNEILYAECKAKQKPKSDEIKKFIFSMDYGIEGKKPNYGYFIHTEELDRQAAGLKMRLVKEKENITFFGPDLILETLENIELIEPFKKTKLFDKLISKLTLLITPKGYYHIAFLQEGSVSQYYTILNNKLKGVSDKKLIEYLKSEFKEISNLVFIESDSVKPINVPQLENDRDTITEVKQSENWFDYTPASVDHFIGRLNLKRELRVFLDKVRTKKTQKRIFFLDGKSGWGKSSLLAELNGYTKKSKYWKNRIYTLAVDTRSANTGNFIGLAFKNLIDRAIEDDFIDRNLFNADIEITSPYDVLSHDSIKKVFSELKAAKKVIVLIFDQFEDQFRNELLFEAFYQFCKDVDSIKENLVVGFSWKTEINIPMGNLAYHKFNQLKDYSHSITIPEFSQNDAKQVILQLEDTINTKIGIELERKLIENSQGFPWLIKKLCIHTLNQFNVGKTIDEILGEQLNYKELFESDLIQLDGEQKKALDFIAKRAYDGNPFEVSEADKISQEILDSLINKRLIIRTGGTYNVYWDIFRDYIVTKTIPVIGESYLLRQSGNTCLEVFLLFEKGKKFDLDHLISNYSTKISESSILNVLIELRSLGLIRKQRGQDVFVLTDRVKTVSNEFFSNYMQNKFLTYNPVLKLQSLNKNIIELSDIVEVLKSIFKTELFQEETWLTYARNLVIWLKIVENDLYNRIESIRRGRGGVSIKDKEDQLPYYSPPTLINAYRKYLTGDTIHQRKYRDLLLFELIDEDGFATDISRLSLTEYLGFHAFSFNKLNEAFEFYKNNLNAKTKDLLKTLPNLFLEFKTYNSKQQIGSIVLSWAGFMYNIKNDIPYKIKTTRRKKGEFPYLSFGPNHAIKTITDIDRNTIVLSQNTKKKIKDLIDLNLVNEDYLSLTENGLKILNSTEAEFELSKVAIENKSIQLFMNVIKNLEEKPSKKEMKLDFDSEFFKGMTASSIKVRSSVYKSWAYYILMEGSS